MATSGDVNISDRDLRALRRPRSAKLKLLAIAGSLAVFAFFISSLIRLDSPEGAYLALREAQHELASRGAPWAQDLIFQQAQYRVWLQRHGLSIEVTFFDTIARSLFGSAVSLNASKTALENLGFFEGLYVSLHFAALRTSFLAIAALRLCLAALCIGGIWGFLSVRGYRGRDLLGETGNGRLFFSGARASFDKLAAPGKPDGQVTGLACPPMLPLSVARASPVGKVLERYGALNGTTSMLAAVVGKHDNWPAFVAPLGEQDLLEKTLQGAKLPQMAAMILDKALALQRHYRVAEKRDELPTSFTNTIVKPDSEGRYRDVDVANLVQKALHRVLTPQLRLHLAEVSSAELAAMILAHEAGKSLAYAFEGGKWVRRSNYPQLCARAVLHSAPPFADEYDFDGREMIRKALVFGSRQSTFAPSRMPVEFAPRILALRQWSEVLMACPHNLQSTADDVELYGLVRELHGGWTARFVEVVPEKLKDQTPEGYCSPSNLIIIPLSKIVRTFREFVSATTRRRLEELVVLVSQRQQLRLLAEANGAEDGERLILQSYERVFAPFTHEQLTHLADQHEMTIPELREWSSLRVVLNSFGWLGRRVGDYAVPETSVIFGVIQPEEPSAEVNAAGLIGKKGMVALRATQLQERWGRGWRRRFIPAVHLSMAETLEEFRTRLEGKEEELPDLAEIVGNGSLG